MRSDNPLIKACMIGLICIQDDNQLSNFNDRYSTRAYLDPFASIQKPTI